MSLPALSSKYSHLDAREKRFVAEIHSDHNHQAAGIRAGYSPKNNPGFFAELRRRLRDEIADYGKELLDYAGVQNGQIIQEMALIAFHNPANYLPLDSMADVAKMGDAARCIQGIKQRVTAEGDVTLDIKFYSKLDALEKLGKVGGLFDAGQAQLPPLVFNVKIGNDQPVTVESE